nr:hypothetical protein [Desulfobulbaceae bacterium]
MQMRPCFLKNNGSEDVDSDAEDSPDFDESILKEPPLKRLSTVMSEAAPQSTTALGQRLIFFMLAILTPVLALPVLLVFLFKSPPPLATVTLLGVSYYKLFFSLLIAAVSLIVSSILFFRTKLPLSATFFACSLFCSIPLVVGMKYDLTLQQAILDVSFFANWPYFLQPFFVFVSLLLPVGILTYITLQIRSIFTRERHSYVFIGAAAFLALSLYLSSYELSRAGVPNILGFIHNSTDTSFQTNVPVEDLPEQLFEPQLSQEETFSPVEQITTLPTQNYDPAPGVLSANGPVAPELEVPGPEFASEALRLEEKLKSLLQEIDSKIIKLSQLKSAIEAQQQTDLSAINASIGLLSKKTDMLLEHFDDRTDSASPNANAPIDLPKEAAESLKPFSSSQKDSTLARLSEQLDFLTRKIETIRTDDSSASMSEQTSGIKE